MAKPFTTSESSTGSSGRATVCRTPRASRTNRRLSFFFTFTHSDQSEPVRSFETHVLALASDLDPRTRNDLMECAHRFSLSQKTEDRIAELLRPT